MKQICSVSNLVRDTYGKFLSGQCMEAIILAGLIFTAFSLPFWTLIAALFGGKLLGLPGIVFFIPFVAVLYSLVRENTYRRLQSRGVREIES